MKARRKIKKVKPITAWACTYRDDSEIVAPWLHLAIYPAARTARRFARYYTKSSGEKVSVRKVTITVSK